MDHRDFAAQFGGTGPGEYDAEAHAFTFDDEESEPVEVPAKYEVCGTCNGKGTHTNPSVDAHGITAEEWEHDWSPYEREGYFRGNYDVQCYGCKGVRVVPVPDLSHVTPEVRKRVEAMLDSHREWQREAAAEQSYMERMGGF